MKPNTISTEVNGEIYQIPENSNIAYLTNLLGLENANVVAELDGNIVPKRDFEKTVLKNGSKLELIRFVGGG